MRRATREKGFQALFLLGCMGLGQPGCAMVRTVEALPTEIGETNQRLARVGEMVTRSNALLDVSNGAMAGLPALMRTTQAGVAESNALMTGTNELMRGTHTLMQGSNAEVARTNRLMQGTHELMRGTNELIAASNQQLQATFWLMVATGLASALGATIAFLRFRRLPGQLEQLLARAQAQPAPAARQARASGIGRVSSRIGAVIQN